MPVKCICSKYSDIENGDGGTALELIEGSTPQLLVEWYGKGRISVSSDLFRPIHLLKFLQV
jgi:hypothetical protein